MKFYLVINRIDYESSDIVKIFKKQYDAREFVEKIGKFLGTEHSRYWEVSASYEGHSYEKFFKKFGFYMGDKIFISEREVE